MASIDDMISDIDQELEDMNYAQAEASKKGLTLGDYDLQSATQSRKTDREKESVLLTEENLKQDVQSFNPPIGGLTASTDGSGAPTPEEKPAYTKEDTVKYKELQQKLIDKLIEEKPEFKDWYERLYNTPLAEDRDKLFIEMKEYGDPHLKQDQMLEALGEEELSVYNQLKSKIMGTEAEQWGKGTRGTKEAKEGEVLPPESFGVKSALHWMGATPTEDQANLNIEYYKKRQADFDKQRESAL